MSKEEFMVLLFHQEQWHRVPLVEMLPTCSVTAITVQCLGTPDEALAKVRRTDGAECRQSSVPRQSLNWLMVLMAEIQSKSAGMPVSVLFWMSAIKARRPLPFCSNSNLINFELKQIVALITGGTFWGWLIWFNVMTAPPLDYSSQKTPRTQLKSPSKVACCILNILILIGHFHNWVLCRQSAGVRSRNANGLT